MPVYKYQCDCGLQFEKSTTRKLRGSSECPSCKESAPQIISNSVNFSFGNDMTHAAPIPQNTGVASIDFDYDRIIKEDADKNWKVIEQRQTDKRKILRDNPQASKKSLFKTPDGGYVVAKKEELQTTNKKRSIMESIDGVQRDSMKERGLLVRD